MNYDQPNRDHIEPVGVCNNLHPKPQNCADSCSETVAVLPKSNGRVGLHGIPDDGGDELANYCKNQQTKETTEDAVAGAETDCRPDNTDEDFKRKLESNCNIHSDTDIDYCKDDSHQTTKWQDELPRRRRDADCQDQAEEPDIGLQLQRLQQRMKNQKSFIKQEDADPPDISMSCQEELVQDFVNTRVTVDCADNQLHGSLGLLKLSSMFGDDRPIRPAKRQPMPRFEPGFELNPLQVGCVSNPDARKLRIVHISDTHGDHDRLLIPAGDILVHSGDFFNYSESKDFEADTKQIDEFFAKQTHRYKIFVAGNHEMSFKHHSADEIQFRLPHVTYLQDAKVTIEGLAIYGSPWCRERGSPANAFTIPFYEIREHAWSKISKNTDLLVTHAAPHGILDNHGETGCKHLREVIFSGEMNILMHMFGHAHEVSSTTVVGGVAFSNGAQCYDGGPIVVDIFLPPRRPNTTSRRVKPGKHRDIHCCLS